VALGSSRIAADYGSYIMKQLKCFNTIKVFDGNDIKKGDIERLKFGGYLTLSQSGTSKYLVNALKIARELELTCINVVNVEDSAITKVGEAIIGHDEYSSKDRNIGLYMKSGYCYCDIKSFVPSVVCMALVALWFSDNKTKKTESK
jgi:fructoselysine-6-P-deglycase FrlB-like protein